MPRISPNFKPSAEQWLNILKSIGDPKQAIGTARADSKLVGDQTSEVRRGQRLIISDEPKEVGGTDKGPSPLDYFMAAVGFCENVTFARYATLNGLDFDSLETSVRGHWDRRGQGDFTEIEPAFTDLVVETRLISSDSCR